MTRVVGFAKVARALLLTTALAACERSATSPTALTMVPRFDAAGAAQLEAPSHRGGTISNAFGRKGGHLEFRDSSAQGIAYQLDVPPDAVDDDATFELNVLPGQSYVVSLKATGAGGADVGRKGFRQAVRLTISYASARHPAAAARMVVLWLPDDGSAPVPMRTLVNPVQKTITAYLPHFCRYTIAIW